MNIGFALAASLGSLLFVIWIALSKSKFWPICLFLSLELFYLFFGLIPKFVPIASALSLFVILALWVTSEHRERKKIGSPAVSYLAFIVLSYGFLVGVLNVGIVNSALELRIFLVPILFYLVARTLPFETILKLFKFLGYSLFINAICCVGELLVGVDFLTSHFPSFVYGTTVRQIGSSLRAPGLMRSNEFLGLTAAIFLITLVYERIHVRIISKTQFGIFFLSASGCLILSTSRSAYLMVVAGWILIGSTKSIATKVFQRVLVPIVIVYVTFKIYVPKVNVLSSRTLVWNDILTSSNLVGHGFGSIGSATSSRFSTVATFNYAIGNSSAVFSDNYYVSLIYQFGKILGPMLIAAILIILILKPLRFSGFLKNYNRSIAIALMLAAFFVDIGEYSIVINSATIGILFMSRVPKGEASRPYAHPNFAL